ncbi:RNA-binding protein [Erythrobacter sp. SG61-1L]|uniref:RNA-binding S4 domain-containing protein n=1 Tax=Erythrobacter sp. SG61-1L TaxID=1603897 RepID=UPI0006C90EF1|nr:S4 domain-containing protein [Erythrobacter sp. SG61-1L]KPL69059.1 RNA-binding protein [Erythrobacter sp. SG61-1L]
MRIDRLLWFLRFAKSRGLAQKWVGEGHIRRNGARVLRLDQAIAAGDVLTLPLSSRVVVIEILSLPSRRGPAEEARTCYRELDASGTFALAGGKSQLSEGQPHP